MTTLIRHQLAERVIEAARSIAPAADDLDEATEDRSEIWEMPAAMSITAGQLRELKTALVAYDEAPEYDGWQPIETAPKDGTKIDVWARDHRTMDVYWSDIQEWWCVDGTYGPEEPTPLAIIPKPTHWRPLPDPPTS